MRPSPPPGRTHITSVRDPHHGTVVIARNSRSDNLAVRDIPQVASRANHRNTGNPLENQ